MQVATAATPLRIAIVYSRLPVPMNRADQMTVAHLIEFLAARGHQVDLYTLDEREGPSEQQLDWLKRACRKVVVFPQTRWRKALGIARCLLQCKPLQVGLFYNSLQNRAVRNALSAGNYDACYVYYLRSAETVRGFGLPRGSIDGADPRPATVLAMQLSQTLNTRRMVESFDRLLPRLIYGIETRLLRRYEAQIWQDFTMTVLIGKQDLDEMNRICRAQGIEDMDNAVLHPHGVDISRFQYRPDAEADRPTLIFSGSLRTNTNANAIRWFVDQVWPKLKDKVPAVKLMVVGRKPGPEVRALATNEGITIEADVPDMADYIARATVCVNPMRAGAGMQNKLIEYMAMGKAVVATSLANEGIGAVPGRDLIIADEAEAMAEAILGLLADPSRRAELGENARRLVEQAWTWEHHFLALEKDILDIARR